MKKQYFPGESTFRMDMYTYTMFLTNKLLFRDLELNPTSWLPELYLFKFCFVQNGTKGMLANNIGLGQGEMNCMSMINSCFTAIHCVGFHVKFPTV